LNYNKLINEKLICAFRWSVLPSIMKMHGPKNKIFILHNFFNIAEFYVVCPAHCNVTIQGGARKTGPPSRRPTWA